MEKDRFYQIESELCRVLTHPIRLHLLDQLRDGEKAVGDLVASVGTSKANISTHLAILHKTGAVTRRRDGQKIYYAVAYPQVFQAFDVMRGILMEILSKQGTMYKEIKNLYR